MPFQKNERGKIIWVKPTNTEIRQVEQKIVGDMGEVLSEPSKIITKKEVQYLKDYKIEQKLLTAGPVDIIIPVYGGLHVTYDCITSIINNTFFPYNLIVVDDCADSYTTKQLIKLADQFNFKLITNKVNKGFAATCNVGMRHSSSPFIILLNSDTIVTKGWLTKMVKAMLADEKNVIVNPTTNNTALIDRKMDPGMSYKDMNRVFEIISKPSYPTIMPTGFCFMIKRELIDTIGLLDEAYGSYGEESDYWMRAIKCIHPKTGQWMGYQAVLVDDTYIFHERGGSFSVYSNDEWMSHRNSGKTRFHQLHPEYKRYWAPRFNVNQTLAKLREPIDRQLRDDSNNKINIAYLTFSTAHCGGMSFIADIVNYMIDKDINVKVINILRPNTTEEQAIKNCISNLRTQPIYVSYEDLTPEWFNENVFTSGVIIGATAEAMPYALKIADNNPRFTPVLHAQSFDLDTDPDPKDRDNLQKIYEITPNIFTVSTKVADKIKKFAKGKIEIIAPGIDPYLYHPRDREKGDDRFTVMIMLRNQYFWNNYDFGVKVAEAIYKANPNIRILGCGVDSVPGHPYIIGLGNLPPNRFAYFLGREVDILFDPSSIHSYGLPALEALASGCDVITLKTDGVGDYPHENLRVISITTPIQAIAGEILNSKTNTKTPVLLEGHNRREQVQKFTNTLIKNCVVRNSDTTLTFITPHLRKQGGPTTIVTTANELVKKGYNVNLVSVYQDSINLELLDEIKTSCYFGLKNLPPSDVIFVPSDSDKHKEISSITKSKKIMLKLSHNPRFKVLEEQGLNTNYDKIITSSKWLKDVCEHPTKDWNYKARPANRVGWYNYAFNEWNIHPRERTYNKYPTTPVILCGLVHAHPLKGTDILFEIFNQLQNKYGNDKIKTVAFGEVQIQDKPSWLNYYYNLSRRHIFELLSQVDIFIGCSKSEGLGRIGLEAMSCSTSCVMSDTGAEYIATNKSNQFYPNALIYPIGDIQAAVNHVETLMTDIKLRTKLVFNGYNTAKVFSDPTNYITNIEKVIDEVLNEKEN